VCIFLQKQAIVNSKAVKSPAKTIFIDFAVD